MKKDDFKNRIPVMVPVSLPEDFHRQLKRSRWLSEVYFIFLYLFHQRAIMRKNQNYAPAIDRSSGWVPVIASELKDMLSNRYLPLIQLLIQVGVLELKFNRSGKKDFVPNKYSLKYRILFGKLLEKGDRRYRTEYITDPTVVTKIHTFFNKRYRHQRRAFLEENMWYLPNLELMEKLYLSDKAIDYALLQGGREDKLIGTIGLFNAGIGKFVSRDEFAGRIHHFAGILDKELRPFLRVQGSYEPMIIADIKSCQPYLISALFYYDHLLMEIIPEFAPVEYKIKQLRHRPDVRLFFDKCSKAEFYPEWCDQVNLSKSKAKSKLFQHVLYSSGSNHHKKKKVKEERLLFRNFFRSGYRSVYEILTSLKRTRRTTLPFVAEITSRNGDKGRMYVTPNMMAQRLETRILLDRITRKLNEKGIISITIHDAFILPKKYQPEFEQIFSEVFRELRINPPVLDIQDLKKCDNNIEDEK